MSFSVWSPLQWPSTTVTTRHDSCLEKQQTRVARFRCLSATCVCCLSANCVYIGIIDFVSIAATANRTAQCLGRRTRDRKVAGSIPGRCGSFFLSFFFSGVNVPCWLLFRYPLHPRLFSQRCRCLIITKHTCTLRVWLWMKRRCKPVHGCMCTKTEHAPIQPNNVVSTSLRISIRAMGLKKSFWKREKFSGFGKKEVFRFWKREKVSGFGKK